MMKALLVRISILFLLIGNYSEQPTNYAQVVVDELLPKIDTQSEFMFMRIYTPSEIWFVNPETWERSLYYRPPEGYDIFGWLFNQESNHLYLLESEDQVPPGGFVGDTVQLVDIDIVQRTRQVIFEQVNLAVIHDFPDDEHLLLLYFDTDLQRYPLDTSSWNTCLLDLKMRECSLVYANEVFQPPLSTYWLDKQNYLVAIEAGSPLFESNIYSSRGGDNPLSGWEVFALAPFHYTHQLLMMARPDPLLTPVPTLTYDSFDKEYVGAYLFDLNTFQLVKMPHVVQPFVGLRELSVSPNDRYAMYVWSNGPAIRTFFEIETGKPLLESMPSDIYDISWLPDGERLIGVEYDKDANGLLTGQGVVVQIDIQTGAIEPLFEFEGSGVTFVTQLSS
jgi:hypothetical protein